MSRLFHISDFSESLDTYGLYDFGMIFLRESYTRRIHKCNPARNRRGTYSSPQDGFRPCCRIFLSLYLRRDMLRELPSKLAADHLQRPSAAGAQAPATFDTPAPQAFVAQKPFSSERRRRLYSIPQKSKILRL